MTDTVELDLKEQIARIDRMQEETRKFTAEQHKLSVEALKLSRDRDLSGWQLIITGMGASAALIGATAAFIKFYS